MDRSNGRPRGPRRYGSWSWRWVGGAALHEIPPPAVHTPRTLETSIARRQPGSHEAFVHLPTDVLDLRSSNTRACRGRCAARPGAARTFASHRRRSPTATPPPRTNGVSSRSARAAGRSTSTAGEDPAHANPDRIDHTTNSPAGCSAIPGLSAVGPTWTGPVGNGAVPLPQAGCFSGEHACYRCLESLSTRRAGRPATRFDKPSK